MMYHKKNVKILKYSFCDPHHQIQSNKHTTNHNSNQHKITCAKMTLIFQGCFSLLELLKERRLHFATRGKNIQFQFQFQFQFSYAVLQGNSLNLACLSIEDLEKITIQFEDQMKEIVIGQKYDCWRHKVFLYGSCEEYPNQSNLQLISFDKFAGFSNDQIKTMISFLQRITEDHNYAL